MTLRPWWGLDQEVHGGVDGGSATEGWPEAQASCKWWAGLRLRQAADGGPARGSGKPPMVAATAQGQPEAQTSCSGY